MRPFFSTICLLAAACSPLRAGDLRPLRLVPATTNLVVRVEHPRSLVETVTSMDLVRQIQQLPFARQQIQTPVVQRLMQLVGYYEKELGTKWPELLDRLAGGGITFAVKAGDDNAPVLFVIDGSDGALTSKFLSLAVSLIEQEMATDQAKPKVERPEYRGIKGYKIGDLIIAQAGTTLLASNKPDVMRQAIDLHLGGGKSLADVAGPNEARKALPADCLAWMWLDLDLARKAPNAKDVFAQPSDNAVTTVLFGGWIDVVRRAPFLAAGFVKDDDKFGLTLRFPGSGHEGQPEQMLVHAPPKGAGTLALLEPKNVILSESFWYDFKALWEKRGKLFNEKIAKDFENSEKQVRPYLPNMSLAKLFAQWGPSHRFVVAHQESVGYKIKPKQYLPNFAYVASMREKEFARSAEGILRAIALLAGGQFNLKLTEETFDGVKIVGYRFPEKADAANDPDGIRFNFSPCFAAVGDQFAVCSTIDFGREIVSLLKKEQANPPKTADSSPLCIRAFGSGGVELMRAYAEQILGQIILDQAIRPEEGQKEMAALENWVRRLGQVEFRSVYLDKEYRFDIEWRKAK